MINACLDGESASIFPVPSRRAVAAFSPPEEGRKESIGVEGKEGNWRGKGRHSQSVVSGASLRLRRTYDRTAKKEEESDRRTRRRRENR